MKIYTIHTLQKLPITLQEGWDFLTDPHNLKIITPDDMGFEIISGADRPMYPGQIIQYNVTPMAGIKTKWVTEITHVQNKAYFVDEQRFGPYSLWHHKHFIKEIPGGIEMEDIVDYKIPLGIIGQWIQPYLIQPRLDKIFAYRKQKLVDLFGNYKHTNNKKSATLKQDIL